MSCSRDKSLQNCGRSALSIDGAACIENTGAGELHARLWISRRGKFRTEGSFVALVNILPQVWRLAAANSPLHEFLPQPWDAQGHHATLH